MESRDSAADRDGEPARGSFGEIAFRLDGQRLAMLNSDRSINVWDFKALGRGGK